MKSYGVPSLALAVALLAFLSSCGAGELPQAKPPASGCLAHFSQEAIEPSAHMALCDQILASHSQLLRAHLDLFIVWQYYGKEREACQMIAALEKKLPTLIATTQDQEEFHFNLATLCPNGVIDEAIAEVEAGQQQ